MLDTKSEVHDSAMTAEQQLSAANGFLLGDEPAKARAIYQALLSQSPPDVQAALHHNIALALEMDNEIGSALEGYQQNFNREAAPLQTRVRSMIGASNCLRHKRLFSRSFEMLTLAYQAAPHHVQTNMLLSAAMMRRNEVEDACRAMLRGLGMVPVTRAVETRNYAQCYYEPCNDSVYFMKVGCATSLDLLYGECFDEAHLLQFHQATIPRFPLRERIRIAYVSEHFHKGSVMSNILPVLANHRQPFAVVSLGQSTDAVHRKVRRMAALYVSGDHAANMSFDVAVCCDGHTGQSRALRYLAANPISPVVVDCVGYPFSTGQKHVTHKLVDSITDPPGSEARYSETLLRLDPCFLTWQPLCGDRQPLYRIRKFYKPSQETHKVLAPNNFKKISESCVKCYRALLESNDKIRLYAKSYVHDPQASLPFFERYFGDFMDRIDLLDTPNQTAAHYDLTSTHDVVVDAFPYNGTVTTLESLWCGVPVVTVTGDSHRARVGKSILSAIGHPDLVCQDIDSFCAQVNRLLAAKSIEQHEGVHRDLAASCVMDHRTYTDAFVAKVLSAQPAADQIERRLGPEWP